VRAPFVILDGDVDGGMWKKKMNGNEKSLTSLTRAVGHRAQNMPTYKMRTDVPDKTKGRRNLSANHNRKINP
jgi:hypothetical protein